MCKCPKCGQFVSGVMATTMVADIIGGGSWNAVAYSCKSCASILSVQIDPIAVKTDIVNEIFNRLRKG